MPLVIASGSKQYTVLPGQQFVVDRIDKAVGDSVDMNLIYSYGDDKTDAKTVQAKIVTHQKGKKIRIVKFKNKSNYHRQYGYRHYETTLEILIGGDQQTSEVNTVVLDKPAAKKAAKKPAKAIEVESNVEETEVLKDVILPVNDVISSVEVVEVVKPVRKPRAKKVAEESKVQDETQAE